MSPLSALGALLVGLLFVWLIVNFIKEPAEFYNLFLIGLTNGAVYGLVALGYSLVYGILELINFAHGDVFMLGGMLVATMTTAWFATSTGLGALGGHPAHARGRDGRSAPRSTPRSSSSPTGRLRNAPRLAPLITAIGMSFILQNIGLALEGRAAGLGPGHPAATARSSRIGGVTYTWDKFIVVLFTIPVLLVLMWLVQRTRQGKAMRATAQDRDAAAMMGINVNRTISFTFLLAGGLAGAAGAALRPVLHEHALRRGLPRRADRVHRRRAGRHRQPARGGARARS